MDTGASSSAQGSKQVILSIERIIEMLDKYDLGVVNGGISSEPLDLWSWPKGFKLDRTSLGSQGTSSVFR